MKNIYWLCLCCTFFLAACGLQPASLADLYEEDLEDVSEISIVDGRTGEKTDISDAATIDAFLKEMEGVTFIPIEDQSPREGYTYWERLFEEERETFSFSSSSAGEHPYSTEPDFHPIAERYAEVKK